jgi:solute carrier family 25, member 42
MTPPSPLTVVASETTTHSVHPIPSPSTPPTPSPSTLSKHLVVTTWLASFLAGGASGATAKTIIAPLDRAKILFQISNEPFSLRAVYWSIRNTIQNEGIFALFRGNAAQILRIYPYSGIQLASFDAFSHAILAEREIIDEWRGGNRHHSTILKNKSSSSLSSPRHDELTPFERLVAGAAAGGISVAVTYPLDLMRARLAVQHMVPGESLRYRGILHAFSEMYKEGGVKSFYKGMAPTLLGILPYAGISFATYGTLKQFSRERRDEHKIEQQAAGSGVVLASPHHETTSSSSSSSSTYEMANWERLVYGGIAGLAGQASTYPLDIVRRRMQTEGFSPFHAHLQHRHTPSEPLPSFAAKVKRIEGGMVDTLFAIYSREGRRGLFKGLSMNVIKGPIAVGVSFTTYDILKSILKLDTRGNR